MKMLRIDLKMNFRHPFTCVELHEGGHKLIDRQWVALHHLKETLSARLHRWVGNEQHLHQFGNQVWVLYVILTAKEDHQERHNVFGARLIENLWKVPEKQRREKFNFTKTINVTKFGILIL